MSLISSAHSLVKFVSGESKAFAGQRLAKIGYKKTKENPNPLESVCTSIPFISLTTEDAITLLPHLREFCEDVQDKIIRARYEAGATSINDSEISVEAICKYLAESASISGGRFTKAAALEWCENSGYSDALRLRFAELLGISDNPTDEEVKQVELQVSGYTDKLAALTGSKTYYAPEVAKKLLRSLEISGVTDSAVAKFEARLQEMIANPNTSPDMLAL